MPAAALSPRLLFAGASLALLLAPLAMADELAALTTAPSAPALSSPGAPAIIEEASLSQPASPREQAQSWFQRLFASPEADARQQALQQLEALGLSLDAGPWIRAVRSRNRSLIGLFLRGGVDVNLRGERGRTALLAAALDHHWDLVAELIQQGANPNIADEAGATAIMAAAREKNPEPLKLLLQHKAELKTRDAAGHTALHYALAAQNLPALRTLIEAGAPVEGRCCAGHDLLTHAFESERKDLLAPVLQAQTTPLAWTPDARACLLTSIEARDAELTRLLLTKHATSPTPEGKAQPLLAYAVLENDLPKLQFLLQCGADPNTPVNSPVEKSFSALVPSSFTRLYLDNEAGMTTLMLAAGMDKLDFVQALLAGGAKRNLATAKYKMPALFFAAHSEVAEIMQALIGDCPTPEQMRVEISLGSQRLNLMRNGVSVLTSPVSTGRPGFATPAGRYVITDKHLTHVSTIYKDAKMPFFMRLNCRDFGMHEGQLPGYAASHGCIRLPGNIARQLYRDLPVGTLVSITR